MWCAGGRGKPWRSTSVIVADTASGYHHLKIDGYSKIKGLPNGHLLESRPFTVGGHRWSIHYYPNGTDLQSVGHMSLFLVLDENVTKKVRAQFEFSFRAEKTGLFPKKTKPAPFPTLSRNLFSKRPEGYQKFIARQDFEKSRHLKEDSFTIRCDILVIHEVRTEGASKAASKSFISVPPSDLHRHLGALLLAGKGTDVVFEVGGDSFAAHRCVLAARSPVFSAELFGSMKESASADVIRIDGMQPQVFKALLYFLYTDSLPEMKDEEDVMCQHLLVAADRYNMDRLKLTCESRLCKYIDSGTVANILALAEPHQCHGLKDACFDFLRSSENLAAAMASSSFEHLSTSCPSVIKELIAMRSAS